MQIWNERLPLVNWKSVSSLAGMAAIAAGLSLIQLPSNGGVFGAAIVSALILYLLATMATCSLSFNHTHLKVGAFPYSQRFELADIDLLSAKVLDDADAPTLRLRRNGIGLPGFQLGWFSSSTGKPLFAATSGRHRRVLVRTVTKYDIVVSSQSPDALVRALHSLASGS